MRSPSPVSIGRLFLHTSGIARLFDLFDTPPTESPSLPVVPSLQPAPQPGSFPHCSRSKAHLILAGGMGAKPWTGPTNGVKWFLGVPETTLKRWWNATSPAICPPVRTPATTERPRSPRAPRILLPPVRYAEPLSLRLHLRTDPDRVIHGSFQAASASRYDGNFARGFIAALMDAAMTHCLSSAGSRFNGRPPRSLPSTHPIQRALTLRARLVSSRPPPFPLESRLLPARPRWHARKPDSCRERTVHEDPLLDPLRLGG
jgi:hypothetical protein